MIIIQLFLWCLQMFFILILASRSYKKGYENGEIDGIRRWILNDKAIKAVERNEVKK